MPAPPGSLEKTSCFPSWKPMTSEDSATMHGGIVVLTTVTSSPGRTTWRTGWNGRPTALLSQTADATRVVFLRASLFLGFWNSAQQVNTHLD